MELCHYRWRWHAPWTCVPFEMSKHSRSNLQLKNGSLLARIATLNTSKSFGLATITLLELQLSWFLPNWSAFQLPLKVTWKRDMLRPNFWSCSECAPTWLFCVSPEKNLSIYCLEFSWMTTSLERWSIAFFEVTWFEWSWRDANNKSFAAWRLEAHLQLASSTLWP